MRIAIGDLVPKRPVYGPGIGSVPVGPKPASIENLPDMPPASSAMILNPTGGSNISVPGLPETSQSCDPSTDYWCAYLQCVDQNGTWDDSTGQCGAASSSSTNYVLIIGGLLLGTFAVFSIMGGSR